MLKQGQGVGGQGHSSEATAHHTEGLEDACGGPDMDPKKDQLSEEGTTVSPTTKESGMSGAGAEETKDQAEKTHTKDGVPEEGVLEDSVPKNGAPEDGVAKNAVPEDSVPKEGVPKNGVPEDGAPKNAVLEDSVPEEGVPKNDVPKDSVPKNSVPEDGGPKNAVPEDSVSEEGVPKNGVPKNGIPEDSVPTGPRGEAIGLAEGDLGKPQKEAGGKEEAEAEPGKEKGGEEEATAASLEVTARKDETTSEPRETEDTEEPTLASQRQKADKEAAPGESEEKDGGNSRDKSMPMEASGDQAANHEAEAGSQKAAVDGEPQEADGKEEAESGAEESKPGDTEEDQEQEDKEPEDGAVGVPSSPEEWPESPSEEGPGLSPDGVGLESEASGDASTSASESSPGNAPQGTTEPPRLKEKKEPGPERRVSATARPRGPRAQNRKAIMDKFGGAATGPTALFRNTKAAGAAVGGVRNMLLEWCRAMTRKYEHVDIQNFSSSWGSGMAFCALIHKFFPDAFDYTALDPAQRRHNFTLAFSTAEKLADCAQLLDVEDMVRLAVPDSKCVYTYIQELYRSLVQKGLVKTKKK
ncbi:smoothelin-like protein 1 isoform X2 [Cavia porcellus]|uniref:smoothelin-like protein 1 isoform X2 n=1 Tax=Cavia porcellus TaxID=10141 RepID=UPI0006619A38|nr:smoothelin-like protein 1 isoform X2 [Cavia porcellus]